MLLDDKGHLLIHHPSDRPSWDFPNSQQLAEPCIVESILLFVPHLDRPTLNLSVDPPNGRIGRNIAIIINAATCQLSELRLDAKTVFFRKFQL